ncbi:uncharacterized protein Z519_04410 [Cladophialophora bantiana CBS 173.52]|uniref:Cupin 2 conserved barrel domain-containing protein n=1 Tax=Cladophialophora bantiana (strain ATCC 10958 / CBS 173.52 / CDC B-1940 / NIH 8579) TaxID=1442370 RepID=A0A0D2ICC7_CLAB1|nr:uncharacterized protein Z519_04410 [Cladophialophora bantiana CBS 173.52]KIW94434.1 hypothetical protein Z519_04410 [Cladophialophora bantiana CBS 173.52]
MPPTTPSSSNGRSSVEFHRPNSEFIMTHTIPPTTSEHGHSIVRPPFHYHIYQSERFHVVSGEGTFRKGTGREPWITLSSVPGGQSTAGVNAGVYYKFENASKTDPQVIDIQLDPEAYESEQRFFRNFFGHMDDCRRPRCSRVFFS